MLTSSEDNMAPFDDAEIEATIFVRPGRPAPTAPDDSMGHYLVAIAGAEPGRCIEIGSAPITIGRDPQQTLAFADSELSRRHARIVLNDGQVIAEDLGSTNGTYVDTARLTAPVALREGNIVRVGAQFLKYERRNRSDVERAQELDRDLAKASAYVQSLLPMPLGPGRLGVDWRFTPSTQLGGDAFGYDWLDDDTFAFFLVDVSGHGVGSAMHSVSVLSALRQRTLPDTNFSNPADVLENLNARFQMDAHNGMFFTIWYGVYAVSARTLTYSAAGHHPAYLVPLNRDAVQPLGQPALMIGVMPELSYPNQTAVIAPGSLLYLFSDGVFEIVTIDQQRWTLNDFLPLLLDEATPGMTHPDRIYTTIRQIARPGAFDDDFSLMAVTFP